MTIAQGGEFIQRLVKNGFVRGRQTLTKQDYMNFVILARDYFLFQKKQGGYSFSTNSSVTSIPKIYKIQNGQVILPQGYNVQGIKTFELLSASEQRLGHSIFPLDAGARNLVDDIFTYYVPMAGLIEFKNLPFNAKKVRIYSLAGADINDTVSNDLMFLIVKEVFKIAGLSEQVRKDTSADGGGTDDMIKAQIEAQTNVPNYTI